MQILDRLAWSEMFESFLANKFAAAKRFGLEGCETLIPGMKALIDRVTELGAESIVMGMPHRGAHSLPYRLLTHCIPFGMTWRFFVRQQLVLCIGRHDAGPEFPAT